MSSTQNPPSPRMLQAMGRAFLKVGTKYADQQMLESGQQLLSLSSQSRQSKDQP